MKKLLVSLLSIVLIGYSMPILDNTNQYLELLTYINKTLATTTPITGTITDQNILRKNL